MNPDTTALVRTSWQRVESIAPAAAALFYANLFAADPALAPLFKGDMTHQGDRLMKMIGAAVAQLDDLPALVPTLEALARRHVGYGVREAHYEAVGAALLKTLGQGLGDEFTPAVREAWTGTYGLIAEVMVAAARAPDATSPRRAFNALSSRSPRGLSAGDDLGSPASPAARHQGSSS